MLFFTYMDNIDNFFIKTVKIFYFSIKSFTTNRSMYWASALAFYSVATMIPFLAILVGAASYFKVINLLKDFLLANFPAHHELVISMIETAEQFLNSINKGIITITGAIFIFLVLFQMLILLEHAFNEIWKTQDKRSLYRKIISYPLVIFVGPIISMMFLSIGITFLIEIKTFLSRQPFFEPLLPIFKHLNFLNSFNYDFIPHLVLWVMIFGLFFFLPYTKVKLIPALLGSFVSTVLFILVQLLYIYLQINITRYNTVYGSFALIPFLLITINWSWGIILYGFQLTYTIQNNDKITNNDRSFSVDS